MNALGDDVQVDEVLATGKYPESTFTIDQLSGLGDASDFGPKDTYLSKVWDSLVGKSQSWYRNVSDLQDRLSVLMAGVAEVGAGVWDMVFAQAVANGVGMEPYDAVTLTIDQALKQIIVTEHRIPSDSDISQAKNVVDVYSQDLAYIKSIVPEISKKVSDAQAYVTSILPPPMNSPSAVGRQAFIDEIKKRAGDLGSDFTKIVIALLGLGILGFAVSR